MMRKYNFLFCCLLLALSALFNCARAEDNNVNTLLSKEFPVKKKPYLGGCPFVSFRDKSLPEVGGREVDFNTSCFVEVDELDIKPFQIIDVRSPIAFQQGHIKGSLNLPLHQIASKRFLKDKKLLLVNSGLPQFEMGQFCQILKDKGFSNVHILRGGLHNWLADRRQLTMPVNKNNAAQVRIENFMMDYEHNLIQIVNLKPEKGNFERITKDAKLLSLNDKNIALEQKLFKLALNEKKENKQVVVVLSENEYFSLTKQLNNMVLKNIFYLISDKERFEEFRRVRKTINQARVDGPRGKKCGS